jgi:VWFA-related protein
MIRMGTTRRFVAVALAALVSAAAPGARQQPAERPPAETPSAEQQPQSEQPIFRAKVDLVRVDVSVSGRGDEPVADLQASEFLVTEDDIPQTVETVQFIRLDGQRTDDSGEGLGIRGRAHGMAEAAKEDVRLFGLFLDDYHIDRHPTITIPLRKALESFVEQLQPTDLVAFMEPLTTLEGVRFTRDKSWLLERIRTFEGRRGQLFPVKSVVEEAQTTQRNVWELRAAVTLSALEALATHLGGLREGRKSIIFVSQGPPVGLPGSPVYPRLEAALQAANRGNVTVHALDPRPLGSAPFGGSEAMRRLSSETGGRAIINTNSHEIGLKQSFADASAYYLVGYSPSRQLSDGKFHRINVRVKRPGVRVTARRGYWAPTEEELNPTPGPPPDPVLTGALNALTVADEGRLVDVWVGSAQADQGRTEVQVTWEAAARPAEGPPSVMEVEPLVRGATESLADPQTIAPARGDSNTPTVARFDLEPGPAALRFTARTADGATLDRWTQSIVVPDYSGGPLFLGTPRIYRTRSLLESRAFDAASSPTPTASRRFRRTDRLVIDVPLVSTTGETPKVNAQLTNREGKVLAPLPLANADGGRARIVLALASLAPSTYVIRVNASLGDEVRNQQVAFTVSQ